MNGEAFQGLIKVKHILLDENICIKKKFYDLNGIAAMQKEVTDNCGFDEKPLEKAGTNQVACENASINYHAYRGFENVTFCYMNETTSIQTTGVTFPQARDDSIQALSFNNNKKIIYLPESFGKKFVSLILYEAINCSIKGISKENFEGLKNLKRLDLERNNIEKILSETFQELTRLEYLYLGKISEALSSV
jgi:Leucine rich repeat